MIMLKQLIESIVEETINEFHTLNESKQNLFNLGFPEVIASLLIEEFGKNSYIIAKWYKDYRSYRFNDRATNTIIFPKDWWFKSNTNWSIHKILDIVDVVNLYNAAKLSEEEYNKERSRLELSVEETDIFNQQETLSFLKEEIKNKLHEDIFFYATMIQDIQKGKLIDLKPYKNLSFQTAKEKYDKKRIFITQEPLKTYSNGYKWIDVGKRCELVGDLMKNCGSAGVMSTDEDKTIITLFDDKNKPHVMVTYSPNQKRISSDEGKASTAVKNEYHDYVLDLADFLGANFDTESTKSKALKLKGSLRNTIKNIEQIDSGQSSYAEIYKITTNENEVYYTDSYSFIPEQDILNLKNNEQEYKNVSWKNLLQDLFRHQTQESLSRDGKIKVVSLYNFKKGTR